MRRYEYKGEEVGEGGVEKSVIKYVRTKWMAQTNIVGYFLYIGLAKYIRASPSARKMSLFFSIIIVIVLSYPIIRIYTILHIYLQVSKTEGLAELDCVIRLRVLE